MSAQSGPPQPNRSDDEQNNQLLREGIAAAKMGDKDTARTKLRELVARDQFSELGWFWLASVVDTEEEKQTCLGNVVLINPKNERAQQMLNQMSEATLGLRGPVRDVPAISKVGASRGRLLLLVVGLLAVAAVVLVVILGGRSSPPPPTQISVVATSTHGAVAVATRAATEQVGGPTAVPTLAVIPPTLPPTWTPEPQSNSGTGSGAKALPTPPSGLTGRLVAVQGSPNLGIQNFPIVLMDPNGGNVRALSSTESGDYAVLTPDGQRVIYAYYDANIFGQALRYWNTSATKAVEAPPLWDNQPPLIRVAMTSLARNGLSLVFVGDSTSEADSPNIYLVPVKPLPANGVAAPTNTNVPPPDSLATQGATVTSAAPAQPVGTVPPGEKAVRLTPKGSGINIWPALSPDGSQVAFVRDSKPTGQDTVDVYVMTAKGEGVKNLTNDGLTNVEAAPAFSPDGKRIAYQASAGRGKNSDIYVMNADGTAKVKITTGEGDNIRPHWSPDGKYVAFSSNRSNRWEVYIVDVDSKAIYQVTSSAQSMLCTDWGIK